MNAPKDYFNPKIYRMLINKEKYAYKCLGTKYKGKLKWCAIKRIGHLIWRLEGRPFFEYPSNFEEIPLDVEAPKIELHEKKMIKVEIQKVRKPFNRYTALINYSEATIE